MLKSTSSSLQGIKVGVFGSGCAWNIHEIEIGSAVLATPGAASRSKMRRATLLPALIFVSRLICLTQPSVPALTTRGAITESKSSPVGKKSEI